MNFISLTCTLLVCFYFWRLPIRWAALPLLVGATYIPPEVNIEVGSLHFTVIRILVTVGVLRVLTKGERPAAGMNILDRLMILWGVCAIITSCFHKDFGSTLVARLGLIYDGLGVYFLLRSFIRDLDDVLMVCKFATLLLVPVAIEMLAESRTGTNNAMILFGGSLPECEVRNGKIRAQGPFLHSILAGTVGATCLPLAIALWKEHRRLAVIGVLTTTAMVVCSRSSGPLMTMLVSLVGLAAWKYRDRMRLVRWGALLGIIGLSLVMNAPVYYLLARIDLTGSSTSYFRAALIEASIRHFDEWWFAGTDYTRHWMASGVGWSSDQTDITNYYIKMGVWGGLSLMLAFMATLVAGFVSVGKTLQARKNESLEKQFLVWTLGAILFAHSVTFLSISYFDQTVIYLYLVLAAIGSIRVVQVSQREEGQIPVTSAQSTL